MTRPGRRPSTAPAITRSLSAGVDPVVTLTREEGLTAVEIAGRLGVHKRTVLRRLSAAGVPSVRPDPTPDNKFVPDDPQAMLEMYEQGASLYEVGEAVGTTSGTARRVLSDLGVPIRPRRSPVPPPAEELDEVIVRMGVSGAADHFEVSEPTLMRWAVDLDVDAVPRGSAMARARMQRDTIAAMHADGNSIRVIATAVDVPAREVRNVMGSLGLSPTGGEPLTDQLVADVVESGGGVDDVICRTGASTNAAANYVTACRNGRPRYRQATSAAS